MPREGFSIDDLLHPKEREYARETSPTHYAYRNPNNARKIARDILKKLKITSPPIDLQPVCKFLMANVVLIKASDSPYLGRLSNGRIEIIEGLPEAISRSTLAHELGHLALSHDLRGRWDTLESLNDSDPHEQEAWAFAGELLLPDSMLRKEFANNPNFDNLARVFHVTRDLVGVEISRRRGYL
jgi:Zn-dependent peptidase ImmA (M78 family)